MRSCAALAMLLCSACTFSPNSAAIDADGDDDIDAPPGAVDAADRDATIIDATIIDAATDVAIDARPPCPTDYNLTVAGSRYARRTMTADYPAALADCADDLAGQTHLATFENGDLETVIVMSGAGNSDDYFVGGECNTTGMTCDAQANWFWTASNAPVATTLWSVLEPRGGYQHAYAERFGGGNWRMVSSPGITARMYLCECDR